jgi:ribose 5-phosphate isomerase A
MRGAPAYLMWARGQWKKGVPVEVLPFAYVPVMRRLRELGGQPVLRMGTAETKAGPIVTDNGNFVLDVVFPALDDPAALDRAITLIPGVTETGLFVGMAAKAFFGQADGSVTTRTRPAP